MTMMTSGSVSEARPSAAISISAASAKQGGKLIIVQDRNEVSEQAHASIDYHQMVERISGGEEKAQQFARRSLVLGMNHCSGGDGAFAVDWVAAIERWAGSGQASSMLIEFHGSRWRDGMAGGG